MANDVSFNSWDNKNIHILTNVNEISSGGHHAPSYGYLVRCWQEIEFNIKNAKEISLPLLNSIGILPEDSVARNAMIPIYKTYFFRKSHL